MPSRVREVLRFLVEFVKHPTSVGAIAPSSRFLAAEMLRTVPWHQLDALVEYGPGSGVFTSRILELKQPATRFVAIEVDPTFAALLHQRHPELAVVNQSVEDVVEVCRASGITNVGTIICGLPWASFDALQQKTYLEAMMQVLEEGGQFITFAYLTGLLLPAAWRFRRLLHEHFQQVQVSRVVWLNLPPAIVYRCVAGPLKGAQ